jgi:hypothetical protein
MTSLDCMASAAQDTLIQENALFFSLPSSDPDPPAAPPDNTMAGEPAPAEEEETATTIEGGVAAPGPKVENADDEHLEIRAIHTSSNIWPKKRAGKVLKKQASRAFMHGVEIRRLCEPHLLAGQTGLFAANPFEQFDILGEYCGLVHGKVYTPLLGSGEYCANLEDVRYKLSPIGLDAQSFGNEGRVINHYANIAETPNVIMKRCHVEELPRIMLVCKRNIGVGEEFLLDYGSGYVKEFLGA